MSWGKHHKGWLSKPMPVASSDISQKVTSPRFCVAEQHGLQEPKYRVVDDLSRSYVDATADTTDTYCPQDLDTLVAQVRTLARLGASNFKAWSVDFSNDYKTIGLHESSKDAATV